jgi:deoxyhypusine synthase
VAGITFDKKVKAIDVKTPKSISKLLDDMSQTGFQGRKLAESVDVIEKMIREKNMTILLGYAGSLSTTGQWRMINWLIENRYIDVLVSTGANISEDIVEAMGYSYLGGNHVVDDRLVFHEGLNRYYDVYGKESDYLEMIEVIAEFISKLEPEYKYSSMEFLHQFGKFLLKKGIRSIVALAAEHNVPVFCPAIVDSPYGDASLVAKSRNFSLTIDNVKDYVQFMTLGEKVKETGVIYIGGGVPKDFIQLFAADSDLLYADRKVPNRQGIVREDLAKKGIDSTYYPHKYAVQITTDSPQWGGLSGATFEEAISWGKETRNGQFVQCYCDATIALPIVTHALAERLKNFRRRGTDFSSFLK